MNEAANIAGWDAVVEWFGCAPNFHDAEVLSIDLRRDPEPSYVRVHAWRTNADTDVRGYFRRDRHALVTFVIRDIRSLRLEDWNHQNVLSALQVGLSADRYFLSLPTIYGVDGELTALDISVSIEAFVPQ